jgi:hypothetical protein
MGSGRTAASRRRHLVRVGFVLVTMFAAGLVTAGVVAGAGPLAVLSDSTSTETTTASDPGTTSSDTTTSTDSSTTTDTSTETTTETTETTTPSSGPPAIATDQDDYAPGSTVTLTGVNWAAGEGIHIFVNDDKGKTWSYDADVAADQSGAFTSQFQLPTSFAATYSVTATGAVSGTATTSFTDGNVNVKTSGVSSAGVTWSRYSNGTCAGSPTASGSITATSAGNGTGIPSGAGAGESLSLTAGSVSGFTLSSWGSGNYTTGNPTTTANPACLIGANSTQNLVVTYAAVTDTTAPTGSITINSGATYSTSLSVTLNLAATDAVGVTAYRVADGTSCSGTTYVSVSSTTSFSLNLARTLPAGDGTKTVCAQYKDAAGNESATYTDAIVLDTQAPTIANAGVQSGTAGSNGWYVSAVTNRFTATDGGSGLNAACQTAFPSGNRDVSTGIVEGTSVTVNSGPCSDLAGNTNAGISSAAFKIDLTGPSAALSVTAGTLGDNGWYTSDVTVHADGTDSVSGPVTCTPDQLQTTETTGHTFNGSCTNNAGLSTNAAPLTVKLDKSGPSATLSVTGGTLGSNGWYTSDVTVHTGGADAISGPVSCSADQLQTTETAGHTFNGSCTNNAGLATNAAPLTVKLDKTAPVITDLGPTTTANGNGWYKTDVVNQFKAEDALSGLNVACESAFPDLVSGGRRQDKTTSGEGAAVTVTSTSCTDLAGNSAAAKTSDAFKIDKTKPSASASAAPAPNANGWNKTNVTVHFSGTDALSGIDTCHADTVLSSEGAGQSASGTCTDKAGNESDPATASEINIDKTAPTATATPSPAPNANGWNRTDVTVTFSGSDPGGSGIDFCDTPVVLSGEGAGQSASGTCTDKAGNESDPATASGIKIDKTAPVITDLGPTTTANGNGWYRTDVVNQFKASDGLSGLNAACESAFPDPVSGGRSQDKATSGEGVAVTVTSDGCTDLAGNTAAAKTSDAFKIDKTKPSATAAATPPPNPNGWNRTDVTVTYSGTDALSGIDVCDAPDVLSSEGAGQSASGTCTDKAGNESDLATASGIKIDKTAPTATATPSPAPNANGWNKTDVTVTFNGSDPGGSGIDSCHADTVLSSEGAGHSAGGTCIDKAGNESDPATASGINIDKTAPVITDLGPTTTANANGWLNHDVVNPFKASDALSGPNGACESAFPDLVSGGRRQDKTTSGEGVAITVTSDDCTDLAGNTAPAKTSGAFKIDKTKPSASASAAPPPNANGWNKTNVTVHFSGTDALSGIDTCHADTVLSSEGAGQSASGTCTDKAGNESDAATASVINIDKTNPTLTWTGGPANGSSPYYASVPPAPTCTAVDSLSGPDTCGVTGYAATVGPHTMTATSRDKAGNVYAEQRSYTVLAWTLTGFFQPVDMGNVLNVVKSGSTVPLKFKIYAGSSELTDVADVTSLKYGQVACDASAPNDDIETVATGGTVLRYDTGQFIYNWKTPSLPGKCVSVTMTTQDGSSLTAFFKLK